MANTIRRTIPAAFCATHLALLLAVAPAPAAGKPLPIIPGAAGYGIGTPAGSGRHAEDPNARVIKVTTLKPDGPGSLRAALEAEGPRVVVFEVGGNIDLRPMGRVQIRNPYCTVAGQTAPSPGITLLGCELGIRTHDVLLQHIRIRTGDLRDPTRPLKNKAGWTQWSERDCMKVAGRNIVIDHCSFSWATDELVQSTASRATFRGNLFAECLDSPKHHKGAHSKGLLLMNQGPRDRDLPDDERQGQYVDVVGNVFTGNADRCPQASSGMKVFIANNLVHANLARPGVGVTLVNSPRQGSRGGPIEASIVGMHFDNVPAPVRLIAKPGTPPGKVYMHDLLVTCTPAERRAHETLIRQTVDEGQFANYLAGRGTEEGGDDDLVARNVDPWHASHMLLFKLWMHKPTHPEKLRTDEPPDMPEGLQLRPAAQVRDWLLATAGARPADRDPVDRRIIAETRARRGGIKRTLEDVGGWVDLPATRRNLTVPPRPNGDDDGDGYTNLEEWLHGFAADVERASDRGR